MKIALCLCGQARSFEEGYKYYKNNLFSHYNVDVYIHSWKFVLSENLINIYNPKKYEFETPLVGNYDSQYKNTPNLLKHPPRFTYNMLYSMYKCSQLVEGDYDWVIKSRTDYALNVKIPFADLENKKLYIPNCRMTPERDFGNDQFAFGSKEIMMKYMSTYLNIDKYYDSGYQFIGEDMMKANLYEHNLYGNNLIYVNMNNPFPPGPHNGTWHSLIRNDYDQWKKH